MREKNSFFKFTQLWVIILLIAFGGSIIILDIAVSYRNFNVRAEQVRSDYITRQKEMIKQEVYRVVNKINHQKSQSEVVAKEKIKSRVYEAYAIVQNIYQQNITSKSGAEIKQMIIDALRPIRFAEGRGYYFVTRLDGVEILCADKPEMEGRNLLSIQDTHGQYIVKDAIEIMRQSGEGFYTYYWTKPGAEGNDFKKISFAKEFKPFNWFIGTGLYVDDIEAQIRSDLLSAISRVRFGKEGYIFINRLNGDALISNGKLLDGTRKLWQAFNKNPEKQKAVFKKEFNAALKPEGDYIFYSWPKLSDPDQELAKTSFVYGLPDLQWLVGAGVYLDDVETEIVTMQTALNRQNKIKMLSFILIVIGIVTLFIIFFNRVNNRLKNDFNLFISFFDRAAQSDEEIDRDLLQFSELERMAEYANKMLEDKVNAQQDLLDEKDALWRSEMKFRGLVESSCDWIWEINSEGAYTYASPQVETIVGYKPEEIVGKSPFDLMPSQEAKRVKGIFKNLVESGKPVVTLENIALHKDGHRIVLETSGMPIFDSAGKYAGYRGVDRDITERKLIDSVLLKNKALLNAIIENLPFDFFAIDTTGCYMMQNSICRKNWGNVVGKRPEDLPFDEKTITLWLENNRKAFSGDIVESELVIDERTYHNVISPIKDGDRVIGILGLNMDISERKLMEEELLKIRKLESVGILAGGIAHDFNNILAAILGNISMALTMTDPKHEIYELLADVEKASLRAKELTQQLLTFSKGGDPVRKIAAIDEVVKDSADFVLRGSNVRCDFNFSEDLWPVAIDTGQISQVIQNIILNASQAMPTGGTIVIDCSNYCLKSTDIIPLSVGDYIKIVVKDQGVGIPADILDKVFDPYFTTKQQGSGLGLAITHSIISKHNGYIAADSEPGQGTTFTIYLPASQGRPGIEAQDAIIAPAKTAHGRIIIMDDEEMIRSFVQRALSQIGYEVLAAKDGDEAILLYQKAKEEDEPVDLIIMDLTIPGGMGGKDAVKEIHKIDMEAKVIVSSGYSNDPVMADFREYGFCAALVKPFRIRELTEFVGKAVLR